MTGAAGKDSSLICSDDRKGERKGEQVGEGMEEGAGEREGERERTLSPLGHRDEGCNGSMCISA